MFYVYIVLLSNSEYYIGQTTDLKSRIKKHDGGNVVSTSRYRPLELVWYCAFRDRKAAINFEKYLKTASGRAFMNKRFI